jgi:hypothetical protein
MGYGAFMNIHMLIIAPDSKVRFRFQINTFHFCDFYFCEDTVLDNALPSMKKDRT